MLELLPDVPAGKLAIAELGATTRDEVVSLERAGIDAVLVAGGDVAHLVGGSAARSLRLRPAAPEGQLGRPVDGARRAARRSRSACASSGSSTGCPFTTLLDPDEQ